MHALELENAARNTSVEESRGAGWGASASGRERRGHSRTRAHSKSLICYVRPPGAATGHRCRPATPQRASTARITLVSCASSSTRNACLSSSTSKHSVSVTQAMRQLRAHCKHQHFPCKESSPFRIRCGARSTQSTALQHKRKQMLASGAEKQLKQGSPVPLCGANIEFKKTDWQIGLLPSAECAPSQAMGETLDRCRAPPSREQHSPRSKRLGGSTPRHLPHRPCRFAAHR